MRAPTGRTEQAPSLRIAGSHRSVRRRVPRPAWGSAALATPLLALGLLVGGPGPAQGQQQRLSPLDSVVATVEGAEIRVQYGRPSMRGRTVFGGLVPWGEVWRTGANEATHLRTSADLVVGEETVPAGHYTLYTIPTEDGWTLIVNGQTGQWGTEYHPERDVARLPMRVETLEEPVETFSISVEEGGERDGVLALEWERTRVRVPFEVLGGAGGDEGEGPEE